MPFNFKIREIILNSYTYLIGHVENLADQNHHRDVIWRVHETIMSEDRLKDWEERSNKFIKWLTISINRTFESLDHTSEASES